MIPLLTLLVAAQEWGEFRGDSRRSGISTANLPAIELEEIWRTEPRLVTPAWPAPARWDAFASLAGLKAMRNYDPVMHPVLADNRVYFGSNTDDHMYCLDAGSGEVLWTFDSGGPIRVPPTVKKNRLWFGSDDGFARCLNALNGELIWEVEAVPGSEKVIHDGRLISFFPVRTGVLVEDGVAFFGASLLPWKPSTLVAVNAGTGSLKGKPNLFRREVGSGWTLEGALLYSKDSIVAPQGRIPPLLFDRKTGAPQGALEGGGGSFVVLTEDEQVLVGPGNKDGWITASEKQSRTKIASYAKGNSMVVHEDTAYMLADRTLASLDRVTGAMLWSRPSSTPFELILAGETLFCGGNDMVRAYRKTDGRLLWEHAIEGRAYGLAVAENLLVVSTDEGVLHAFAPSGKKAELPVDDWVAEPSTMSRPEPRPKLPKRGLLDHWVFEQPERIEEQVFPNDPRTVSAIRNQVKNRPSARPMAPLRLVPCGSGHAAELDGKANDFAVPGSLEDFELPLKGLTVGAWVRVDRPMEWGGILSAGQDNGEYERGWFLGFRHNHLSFGLAAEEGGGKQHWVQSPTAFQPGGWHWVVGTWDGKEQNLWVDGALVASSNAQSGSIAMPDRIHYQIGAYRDDNEWYRMTGQLYEVAVWSRALRSKELEKWYEKSVDRFPDPVEIVPEEPKSSEPKLASLVLESGPFVKFSSRGVAHVTWLEAQGAMPKAVLEWREQGAEDGHWNASSPGDSYPYAIADKLNPNTLYEARIRDQGAASELFEIDTHFDGSLPPSPLTLSVVPPEIRAWGDSLRSRRGIAVFLGLPSKQEAVDSFLAQTECRVVVVHPVGSAPLELKQSWLEQGLYGSRILCVEADNLEDLRWPPEFANLVVSTPGAFGKKSQQEFAERCVQPLNGVLFSGGLGSSAEPQPALAGSAPWSHMYGLPNNAAFSGESLRGATSTSDMEVQWFGRPGARHQTDRQNRKPAPLAAGGRLFVQGNKRISVMDSYNGSLLWSLALPQMARFNVPRDSSNMVAHQDALFLALEDRVWKVDGATGEFESSIEVPTPKGAREGDWDWGYLAHTQGQVLGSSVKKGALFTEFWGGAMWYDARSGPSVQKVCSDALFAFPEDATSPSWVREEGLIVNPTITAAEGVVYFLENRNAELKEKSARRIEEEGLWKDLWMVAVDQQTGDLLWEREAKPQPGRVAVYLAHSDDKLVLVTSDNGFFHTYAFDASNGKSVWRKKAAWEVDHHGKAISRPLILNGAVYLRPVVFDLKTGELLKRPFPAGHQCGTYVASESALFLRAGDMCVWEAEAGKASKWTRLRPDCWISTIPADGMLLSPEGGGGCSCGSWLQTSLGFRVNTD